MCAERGCVVQIQFIFALEFFWGAAMVANRCCDQYLVNQALFRMGMVWERRGKDIAKDSIDGKSRVGDGVGLKATVLPKNAVCRETCSNLSAYAGVEEWPYVWHVYHSHRVSRKDDAQKASAWCLRDDWKMVSTRTDGLSGTEWLRSLYSVP